MGDIEICMGIVANFLERIQRRVLSLLYLGRRRETEHIYPMTSREFEALKGIARKRGAAHPSWIAARLGVSMEYVRLLCSTLLRDDYVDVTSEGLYILTARGKLELHRRGVLKNIEWRPEDLELLPPEVRQKLAHELADEIKKEVGSTIGSLVEGLPRESRGRAAKETGEIKIKTDYAFPLESERLEHTLGGRAEKERKGKAEGIDAAAKALKKFGKKK